MGHRFTWVWAGLLLFGLWSCDRTGMSKDPSEPRDSDAGTTPSALDGGEPDAGIGAGPWPNVPLKNYSKAYGIGPVQSVGVDDAYNIWLLYQDKIGVLRPGDSAPNWTARIGQAAPGFGPLALYSTVICGGSAGRAYVGYAASDALSALRNGLTDPEYLKGDLDVVKLNPDGTVSLEEHLTQTVRYAGKAQSQLGLRNSNNWQYDEDRTILVCTKVMQGDNRGDVFVGTNHGVTMIRGLVYNSHRHPAWYDPSGSLRIGYNYTIGIGQDGDVLIANEYKVGIVPHPAALLDWDNSVALPWKLDAFVSQLNGHEDFDFWRGFTQAKGGEWYLSSAQYGLWTFSSHDVGGASFMPVKGLPTSSLGMVQATDDGSVFVATEGAGLWRLRPDKSFEHVSGLSGSVVRQLVYDPTVSPSMLYVLTNSGLSVLRGF